MGLTFLLRHVRGECFTMLPPDPRYPAPQPPTPGAYAAVAERYAPVEAPPSHYLYVSIGSGVSIIEVSRLKIGGSHIIEASQ